ncbi:MAG TPA: Gfo/Idh/MocA family oxidoreductase [Mycobacteriales bacterium]|nr:Gfo/Idh/MocA family oxidoreductase [Mycobacteriales bacterium]
MRVGIGMVGYAFMGAAHSQAWRNVNRYFDVSATAELTALCGRNEEAVTKAAKKFGFPSVETDWHTLIGRDDVDLVDVCTPGFNHAEISIAALEAGKHVLCEKPLANTADEARAMAAAAEKAKANGVQTMVGFNYRRVPAAAFAKQLVADGRLGKIRHVRAQYLQDWLSDPNSPLGWRMQKDQAGSGALGDLGAHIVDLAQFITGQQIGGVSALTETFVKERPLPKAAGGLGGEGASDEKGPVTVDDAALFLARFDGGAIGTFEATRFAQGRKNGLRLEVNGDGGSIVFDLERLNELEFFDAANPSTEAGFRRVLITEGSHPYLSAWWPAGHIIGWEHTFTHEAKDFLEAIVDGTGPAPSFADGLQVQLVLDAVVRSAEADSSWTTIN